MLLALARHLGQHKIKFEREVRLVAFSGEEQGLVGSQVSLAPLGRARAEAEKRSDAALCQASS